MTPAQARTARKKTAERLAKQKAAGREPKPPDEQSNLPEHEVPPVEVMPDCPAQVSSVVGGAMGQAWGLPRPVSQEEFDDQSAAGPAPKDEEKSEEEKSDEDRKAA